jgi:uncharacterized protein (TIGR00369 family)
MVEQHKIMENSEPNPNLHGFHSNALPNLWSGDCFGCSPRNQYGLKLQVSVSENGCFSHAKVPKQFSGFDGIVHGGIVATLLDEISAWTLIINIQELCVTQNVTIQYHRPVPVNTSILVEGSILNANRHSATIRSFIKSLDGKVLAESISTWIIPGFEALAKITGKEASFIEEMFNKFIEPIKKYMNKKNK